jgi:hypothetical protein
MAFSKSRAKITKLILSGNALWSSTASVFEKDSLVKEGKATYVHFESYCYSAYDDEETTPLLSIDELANNTLEIEIEAMREEMDKVKDFRAKYTVKKK